MVGLGGLEPPTSRLSGVRSNQLSYKPILSIDYYIVHDKVFFDKYFFHFLKKTLYINQYWIIIYKWRSRRDLNSRAGYPTYTLSRGASSAS